MFSYFSNIFKESENPDAWELHTPETLKTFEKIENPKENWKVIRKHWKNWKTLGFPIILQERYEQHKVF